MAPPDQRSVNFYPTPDRPIPKPILIGAAFIAVTALVAIGYGRVTGVGLADTPNVASVAERRLLLDERPDGSVAILDAKTHDVLTGSGPGQGSFAVEALRNLERNRTRKGVPLDGPFFVALKADGRLVVEDHETGHQVELRAFGEKQRKAFADMLPIARVRAAEATPGGAAATAAGGREGNR